MRIQKDLNLMPPQSCGNRRGALDTALYDRLNSKGPLIQSLHSNSTNSSINRLGITDNNPIDTDKLSVTTALAPLQYLTNRMDAHSIHEDELPSHSADGSSSSSRREDTAATSLAENSPKNIKQQDNDDTEFVARDDNNSDEDVGFGPPPAFPSSNKALGKRKHTVLEVSAATAADAKQQDDSSEEEEGGDAAKSSGTGNTSSSNRNKQSQMIHRMKTTETTEEETTNDDNDSDNITMNKSGEYYDAMLLASLSDLDQIQGLNKAGSLTARSPTDETEDDIGSPNPSTTGHTPSVAPTPTRSNVNPNNRPYALMPKSGPLYTTPNSKHGIAPSSAIGVSNNPQHSPDRRDPKAITPRSADGRGPLPEGIMYGGRSGPPPHHYQYPGYHQHPGYPPHHSQHYPPHHSQHYPPPHASAAGPPPPPHHGHPPPPSGAYPPYHHPHGYYRSPSYPPPHGYHHHGGAPAYALPPPPPPPPAGPYRPHPILPPDQALPPGQALPPAGDIPEPVLSRTRSNVIPEEGSGDATDCKNSKSSSSKTTRGMPAPSPPPQGQHYPLLESSSYISGDDGSPPRKLMSTANPRGSGVDVPGQVVKEYTLPSAFTPPRGGARPMSYHYDPYHQASAYPPPPPPDYYGGPPPYAPPPPVYDPYEPYDYSTVVQPQPNVNSGDVLQASVSDELEPNYRGGVPPPPPMVKGSKKNQNQNHQQFRKGGRSIHSEPVILRKKFSWRNYPELEEFLIANRSEYLRHSALNYTAEQKHFNNQLTEGLLEVAARINYVFDESCFNFVAVRDRIRCYYKSFVQSSKKRGNVLGFPSNQGEEMMENQHYEGVNDYNYGVSG